MGSRQAMSTSNESKMAADMCAKTLAIYVFIIFSQVLSAFSKTSVVELDEDNWDQMLTKEWMVEFYAPWCPACKALQPVWKELGEWADDLNINVARVDVTTAPGLSGRFMVTALPTIFHVVEGAFRQYRGPRDRDSLISYVEDKRWQKTEPIPSWKAPGSAQMSAVAWFFKLSQVLRSLHSRLMDHYGLPVWGSYLIFAVATILVGALLGLMMVCVIDVVWPPRPQHAPKTGTQSDDTLAAGDNAQLEEDDFELKDDLVDEDEASDAGTQSSDENASPAAVRRRKPRKDD